jgi:trimethylamine--corrinoid protein Co-methyltransferase
MRKFVDEGTLQDAYRMALDIIENAGIRFESEVVRERFEKRDARIEGDTVYIPRHLIEEALASTPKQDYSAPSQKRVVAATPFSNAPFILNDETGAINRCCIADAIKLYQINETSSLYECTNPGCADPYDNDTQDQFVAQIAMSLKYSDKYPSFGLRATASNSLKGDVYGSARKAFRLVREFYDTWDEPVMTQGICPNPPLTYDRECLDNLRAAIDEKQAISIFPCSIGFMTAPETIMGIVIHDFAMALAGLVYIQLESPGHAVSLCEFSTISDLQTLQPNYGSNESVFIQIVFYELCKSLSIPCSVCGSYSDGVAVDYQAGMEGLLTTMLPFSLTEVNEVWCYPGILAGFACGSFHKAILDEEMLRYTNRMLQGVDMTLDSRLPELLVAGRDAGNFLGIGSMAAYRRDNYMTKVFNKWGMSQKDKPEKTDLKFKVQKVLEDRIAAYELPERSAVQKKMLQMYLPSQCQYR